VEARDLHAVLSACELGGVLRAHDDPPGPACLAVAKYVVTNIRHEGYLRATEVSSAEAGRAVRGPYRVEVSGRQLRKQPTWREDARATFASLAIPNYRATSVPGHLPRRDVDADDSHPGSS